jgi:hypothetical protein
VLILGSRSTAATWSPVKTGGILFCESFSASVAALRANPRSRSFKLAELCWSGHWGEGIDCREFSAPAASVDVSGADCPVSPADVGCACTIGCSVCESAASCWKPTSALCCKIGFAGGDVSMTQLDGSFGPRPSDASICGGLQGRHGSTNGYPEAVGPSARRCNRRPREQHCQIQ